MRVFVAIELSDDVRAALAGVQRKLAGSCTGVKWIPSAQLHITLKFLGEVDDALVPKVADTVKEVAAESAPFEFRVSGCGCFPPRGAVRIIWAGSYEPRGVLSDLAERVDLVLEPLGFPRESRPFSPHITIGRVREDPTGGKLRAAVAPAVFVDQTQSVREIVLMSSVLSPKGPTYSIVSRAKLS